MRAIVVGAGAVGAVYGHHLARGGADVDVLVRAHAAASAQAGFNLTRIGAFGKRTVERFAPRRVLTSAAAAADGETIDQVWVALPSDAIRAELLADLARVAPAASIVVLAPGGTVRDLALGAVGATRAVFGEIGMISYATPLEGSSDPAEASATPGLAFFLTETKLSSTSERRALSAATALRRGGCKASVVEDATADVAFGSAVLMPTVVGLELGGFSFERFRAEHTDRTAHAIAEAVAIARAVTGRDAPVGASVVAGPAGPFLLRAATLLAPRLAPLDIERFLAVHFTKVGSQTSLLLTTMIEQAARLGLPADALRSLLGLLEEARAQ